MRCEFEDVQLCHAGDLVRLTNAIRDAGPPFLPKRHCHDKHH
jgi:hypothetical protein